ncbi:MAG: protein-L-isoaspartate(D-aspartate) O-methyltransferase [Gammaproteobacteria bacterium]|nr:protein-L-isoaspartate(D-aspartate) O-methyltransferase [Gammaproteobacteria bacterium]
MNQRGIGMTSARTRERLVERLRKQGIESTDVLERIRSVPRHLFVDEALASRAYEDTALPIGQGQTISQPFIVARMTEALLAAGPVDKVLEIGTGCGYQTAVLSPLVGTIHTVERIGALLTRARQLLRQLEIRNARFRHADGWDGWQSKAPFDGIIVSAAPRETPSALLDQLAEGGRLVIPIGPNGHQKLMAYTRKGSKIEEQHLGAVSFVPLLKGVG